MSAEAERPPVIAPGYTPATVTDKISAVVLRKTPKWWYVGFAIYLVGINGGVRIWQLERYVSPDRGEAVPLVLNTDRWALEVYRTLIGTLQSIAVALLIFFVVALFAYLMARSIELRTTRSADSVGSRTA